MAYATGSTNLTVFLDEIWCLLNSMSMGELQWVNVLSSTGIFKALCLPLQMRVITHDNQRVLKDWHHVDAVGLQRFSPSANRLSSQSLNGEYYICQRLSDRRLLVAKNKTELFRML